MERKPRVLFIMHMPPPMHGAAIIGKFIHDSKYINEKYECYFLNEAISTDVSHIGKIGLYKFKSIFDHARKIIKMIREVKPDLIYITPSAYQPEIGMIRYVLEFMAINSTCVKKLIHFHNKGVREKCQKWWIRWYYKMLFYNAKVIFIAKGFEKQFDIYLQSSQILYCPNGIQRTRDAYSPLERSNNSVPKLLFLSNMMKEKGVYTLLEAIEMLKVRGYLFSCDFVGAWKDITEQDFNNYCLKHEIKDRITAYGPIFGASKLEFYKSADIFVFPSYNETFGLVLAEAMEYELPCVTTKEGGMAILVEDGYNGFLIEKANSKQLADRLAKLINNSELRERMGKAGFEKFNREFSIDKFELNLSNCIDKAMGNE